jgi:hypothetical protein
VDGILVGVCEEKSDGDFKGAVDGAVEGNPDGIILGKSIGIGVLDG